MMPSSMARPRSQPKRVFKRVPQSKPHSRDAAFGPYRTLIEKFYIEEERPLKWIMDHLKNEYEFNSSVKQYKSQLRIWGLRHNLSQRDAAFTLRLLNQAKSEGREEVVSFSGQPRSRQDIIKYIARNDKIVDENDLLSRIADDDKTPPYIKLQSPQEQQTPGQLPPTPPSASPSGFLQSSAAYRSVSPMRVPIPSPESTPRSSGEWLHAPADAAPRSRVRYSGEAFIGDANRSAHAMDIPSQPAMSNIISPFWPNQEELVPAEWCQVWDNNNPTQQWPDDFTHAALSVTPAVVDQFGDFDLDIYRFGDHTHSPQLNDGSRPAYFVMWCLYWLICAGQNNDTFQKKSEYYLNNAVFCFLCMLPQNAYSPPDECLGALSIVAVLFDCYGQLARLSELLMACDELTKKHLGGNNPLTVTIEFKRAMLQGPGCPPHDTDRLRHVVDEMSRFPFGSPRSALTARYNLAWAVLENELKKEDRVPSNFEPVRRELADLLEQSQYHFGNDRIETIMMAATLARATFYCGDAEEAERIIVQRTLPRVRQNFVDSHPYVWEAKHRHAFFLFQLARKESGPSKSTHLQLGEQLLREVVRDRYRVLGETNPKSEHSFYLLRDILKEQGRLPEANSLREWCERELSQYGVY